jgi:hypothetical protein
VIIERQVELDPLPRGVRWALRVLLLVTVAILGLCCYLVGGFATEFEVFSPAIWSKDHGLLGPRPRHSACVKDVGKFWVWTCDDISVFERHRMGCRIWLRMQNLGTMPRDVRW